MNWPDPVPVPPYSPWGQYWAGLGPPLGPGDPGYPFHPVPLSPMPPTRGSSPVSRNETNRAPLPDEAAALRQILKTKQELATHLDGIIKVAADDAASLEVPYRHLKTLYESAEASYAAGQEHLHTLIQVKQNMQPSVQHICSLLHPIRRYPTDILSLIFIAAVESEHHYDHLLECDNAVLIPRYKRRHAAIDISHVCRGWRALAHATPDMWSTVRISLARRSNAASKLALFARHAKAVPLNVIIHHLTPSFFPTYASLDSEDEETVAPLFNAVTRLKSLEIHFSHFRALSCLPRLGTNKLDHLQELSLRSDPIVLPTTPDFSLTSYLASAPRLRKLTLTHVALTVTFHDTTLTLPNLSKLVIHGPLSADAGYGTFMFSLLFL
jgi:F-box-like